MGAHLDRARQLMELRRYDLAEQALRDELAAEPNSPDAHLLLGECLEKLHRFHDACAEVEEAIRLAPEYGHAHYLLSWVLQQEKLWANALAPAKEAVRLVPTFPGYLGNLAFVYYMLGQNADAAHFASEGLRQDPNHIRCLNARALVLAARSKYREAHEVLKHALAQNPNDEATYANLGYLMLLSDKKTAALRYYSESLRLDPHDPATQNTVASTAREQIFVRLLLVPGFLTMLAGIWTTVAFQRDRVELSEETRHILLGIMLVGLGSICLPWICLAQLSPARLLRLNLACRELVPDALRCACRLGVGSVLTLVLSFAAAFWFESPAMFLPAVAAWVANLCVNILAFNKLGRKPRMLLSLYAVLVSLLGLGGMGLLAGRFGCIPLCFYVLGSFHLGLFLYTFAPQTARNAS
jgi:tetratricopeptide (TPR) repeat protein